MRYDTGLSGPLPDEYAAWTAIEKFSAPAPYVHSGAQSRTRPSKCRFGKASVFEVPAFLQTGLRKNYVNFAHCKMIHVAWRNGDFRSSRVGSSPSSTRSRAF